MVDFRPHLCIDGEAAVEAVAGSGEQAHGEFALEHEDADAGRGREGEELEC